MHSKTIESMREILWAKVPLMPYLGNLRYRAGLKLYRQPRWIDFPPHFSLGREITKDDAVLELGADFGQNTARLARLAKWVYAFEPQPYCYRQLRRNTLALENVSCYDVAVSDRSGTMSFNVHNTGGSLHKNDAIHYTRQIGVRVVGINNLPFRWNVGVFDCEGSEAPIFRVFSRWEMVDRIYCETHSVGGKPTMPAVLEALGAHFPSIVRDMYWPGLNGWVIAKR